MLAHILPCALEVELLTMLAYVVAHARDVLSVFRAAVARRWRKR